MVLFLSGVAHGSERQLQALAELGYRFEPEAEAYVNKRKDASVAPGTPIFLMLQLDYPRGEFPEGFAPARLQLAGKRRWTELLKVEVTGPQGPVQLRWRMKASPGAAAAVSAKQGAQVEWLLEPAESLQLTPGRYQVRLVLDSKSARRGWKGQVVDDIHFDLTDRTPTSVQQEEELMLKVEHHLRWGGPSPLQELEKWLALNPEDAMMLQARDWVRKRRRPL
jgi:hypothetical protein